MARRGLIAACMAALALTALVALTGAGGARADDLVGNWGHNALMLVAAGLVVARVIAIPRERAAWSCFAVALVTYAAGEIVWTAFYAGLDEPPYPSVADALWLAFYPACYVGMVLLVRERVREFQASLWLDGLIAGLVVAAVGAAAIFPTMLDATEGSAGAVATTLAYPLGDIVLMAIAVGVIALTGWRPGSSWLLLAAGLTANGVADAVYGYQSATGAWVDGSIFDALFPAAALLIAWSAWKPARTTEIALEGWRTFVIPAFFMTGALVLSAVGMLGGVTPLAAVLLIATGAVVLVRFALTFGENLSMLAVSREEATTDLLTGLANRRALMRDLPAAVEVATRTEPRTLALFDLDGFKRYNDSFGHPAGDALLARLAGNLQAAMRPFGEAYRLGGDEFCVLVDTGGPKVESVIAAASAALAEEGDGFVVTSSHGVVTIPADAADPRDVLQLADRRMYGHKAGRTGAAERQTRDVLLGVLRERHAELHEHMCDVARLAGQVGDRLGMTREELDVLVRAAELHDIGKMAVPDAILQKPGPLDSDEWAFMRRHTVVGERILGAAEALRPVAAIVRSSHERWDGAGYPDGLAGEAIPLGARIVFVCDAFDAMVTDRTYRPRRSVQAALAELRACAGTQFDPAVVAVFTELIAAQVSEDAASSVASKSVRGIGPTQGELVPASW
jgi:two-component system cell cycle response regulator